MRGVNVGRVDFGLLFCCANVMFLELSFIFMLGNVLCNFDLHSQFNLHNSNLLQFKIFLSPERQNIQFAINRICPASRGVQWKRGIISDPFTATFLVSVSIYKALQGTEHF
jgi:hypothetical protein